MAECGTFAGETQCYYFCRHLLLKKNCGVFQNAHYESALQMGCCKFGVHAPMAAMVVMWNSLRRYVLGAVRILSCILCAITWYVHGIWYWFVLGMSQILPYVLLWNFPCIILSQHRHPLRKLFTRCFKICSWEYANKVTCFLDTKTYPNFSKKILAEEISLHISQ